jgi:hypothetical protein
MVRSFLSPKCRHMVHQTILNEKVFKTTIFQNPLTIFRKARKGQTILLALVWHKSAQKVLKKCSKNGHRLFRLVRHFRKMVTAQIRWYSYLPKMVSHQTVTYQRFWKMVVASKLPHGLLSGSWVRGGLDVLKRRVESILALFAEALPHPPSCAPAPLSM